MSKLVYIVGGRSPQYERMFQNNGFTILHSLKENVPDLVCFTGGEDVTPSFYGEQAHPSTYNNSHRDYEEKQAFKEFIEAEIPMVGICRGGQFLNVMNGGKMYQHVSKHTRDHLLIDALTDQSVYVTSTHHQMMRKSDNGTLIAYAQENGTKQYMDNGIIKFAAVGEKDTEVVFYPHTQCLCYQPHPEFASSPDEHQKYFFSLIKRYLFI
jgi:gamma-glutamyl-gamma-aminobutyrate hydrolase PuuD